MMYVAPPSDVDDRVPLKPLVLVPSLHAIAEDEIGHGASFDEMPFLRDASSCRVV